MRKKVTNHSKIFFHSIENFREKFSEHKFDDGIPDKFVVEHVSVFYGINIMCQAIHKQIYNILKDVIRFHATKKLSNKNYVRPDTILFRKLIYSKFQPIKERGEID